MKAKDREVLRDLRTLKEKREELAKADMRDCILLSLLGVATLFLALKEFGGV